MKQNFFAVLSAACLLQACAITHDEHGQHAHDADHDHDHVYQPPWQEATSWPSRFVVTLPEAPQSSFAVTWRTNVSVDTTYAEIVEATDDARFDLDPMKVAAETETLNLEEFEARGHSIGVEHNLGIPPANFHSVVFEDLKPDTQYVYRVRGAKDQWSEWFQTKTAAETGPIQFVYVGDAQNAVRSHWSRLIRAAFQDAPKADFILHAGDLVNRASRDYEWAEWFEAVGFIHGMIPAIPVAGNHEYQRLGIPGAEQDRVLSIVWRPQFTLPEEPTLDEDLQEVAYDVRYSKDLHLFILSTQNNKIEQQAEWLDREMAASDAKWKIVSMHHPIFSSGDGRDSPERRAVLLPIMNKHKPDLVLQGHDHTYARGTMSPVVHTAEEESGAVATMYVNSVSGPKQYDFQQEGWDKYADTGVTLDRKAENTQFFQVITIDGDVLSYEARTAMGELYDAFQLSKEESGLKTLTTNGETVIDERLFNNTGEYVKP